MEPEIVLGEHAERRRLLLKRAAGVAATGPALALLFEAGLRPRRAAAYETGATQVSGVLNTTTMMMFTGSTGGPPTIPAMTTTAMTTTSPPPQEYCVQPTDILVNGNSRNAFCLRPDGSTYPALTRY